MKIVVLDGYTLNPGDLDWKGLEALGELTVYPRIPYDTQSVIAHIGDAEAVFTNKVPLTKEVLDACPQIRFIGVLATGYNVVDVAAAKEKGIPVCNVPTYGSASVGQFAIALLLEICHHIGHHSGEVAKGRWSQNQDWCFWDYPLIELSGLTMGIIGYGRIGQSTGKIAQALGMKLLVVDSHKNEALESETCKYVELDELLAKSDVISLHCPLFPSTQGIINKENIAKMKDGVIILNNARGPLIVEEDLCEALKSGKVAAAGLDVVSTEPIKEDNCLLTAPNCIITPHISWASKEARSRLMDIAVNNLAEYVKGNLVNVVNP